MTLIAHSFPFFPFRSEGGFDFHLESLFLGFQGDLSLLVIPQFEHGLTQIGLQGQAFGIRTREGAGIGHLGLLFLAPGFQLFELLLESFDLLVERLQIL